jgi:hypothetical protein
MNARESRGQPIAKPEEIDWYEELRLPETPDSLLAAKKYVNHRLPSHDFL